MGRSLPPRRKDVNHESVISRLAGAQPRPLAVVDDFTRECLCLVPDTSLSGLRVGRELDAIIRSEERRVG